MEAQLASSKREIGEEGKGGYPRTARQGRDRKAPLSFL